MFVTTNVALAVLRARTGLAMVHEPVLVVVHEAGTPFQEPATVAKARAEPAADAI